MAASFDEQNMGSDDFTKQILWLKERKRERETEEGERREDWDTGEAHTQQPVHVKYMLTIELHPKQSKS